MKIAMVSPSRESEKAISGYALTLVESMQQNKIFVDPLIYEAGSLKSFCNLFSKLKKYDVVHVQHEYNLLKSYGIPFFFIYFYFLFFKKYKLITTMHTALSLKTKFKDNFLKSFLRKCLYFFQNKLIWKASDQIIVHSKFFVPILTKEYGFIKKGIRVIPQGILVGMPRTSKLKAKKDLKLKGNVFLIMGNLTEDSGADIVLRECNKINGTFLVVANPSPVNPTAAKRTKKYLSFLKEISSKCPKKVRFDLFEINDQNPLWWKYLSAADFLILAYRGGIGSGMFAHAMATKTPVITSDIPFFKEIEKEFSCVKTVGKKEDYAKIIKKCLISKNYEKMVKGCKQYFKVNNLDSIAKKYSKIYSKLF